MSFAQSDTQPPLKADSVHDFRLVNACSRPNSKQLCFKPESKGVSPSSEERLLLGAAHPRTVLVDSNALSGDVEGESTQMNERWSRLPESPVFVTDQLPTNLSKSLPVISPPPPPPPTSPGYHSQDLHLLQEQVRDSRDALVGARFRLHTKRREFRTVRQEAGAETGAAYNLFKTYLLSQTTSLPHDILEAIQKVDELRDKLGNVETDYDDAEEKYNQQEWSYTRLEESFVDSLPDDATVLQVSPRDNLPATETDLLTRFADASADVLNYSSLDELMEMSPDERQTPLEQEERGTVAPTKPEKSNPLDGVRVARSHQIEPRKEVQTPLPRSFSEADLEERRPMWSSIRYRIDEWLLDSLNSSSLQQQCLRAALSQHNLGDRPWLQIVSQYWYLDSPHGTVYRTGDTTASESSEEQQLPGVTSPRVTDVSPLGHLKLGLPTAGSKGAVGTQCTSAISESSLGSVKMAVGLPVPSVDLCSEYQHDVLGQPIPEGVSIRTQAFQEGSLARTAVSGVGDTSKAASIDNSLISSWPTVTHLRGSASETDQTNPGWVSMVDMDSFSPNSAEETSPAGLKPALDDHEDQPPSQQTFQLFIEVPGIKPWTLPLVRLTPVAQSIQRLDCIPFVSTSDTPFRLPGPSKFCTSF
ncbi:hypothetical protein EJ07DRAFT_157329 [Lizonia empirigonia]|nr:hypothetical protein EJ07DRAFT_157329 [Lizonia empirigonia]